MNLRLTVALLTSALLLCGLTGCGMMQQPTAQIVSVQFKDAGLTHATMLFNVSVDNPYNFALPMSNIDYALASQGQQFMSGKADVEGEVPANSSRVLGVPVRINFQELITTVRGARPGSTIPYTADLGLSVNVPALGPMRLPMSTEGQLTVPTADGLLQQLPGLIR